MTRTPAHGHAPAPRGGRTAPIVRATVASAVLAVLMGCTSSDRPPQPITVTPAQAFTDLPVILQVGVPGLRPALTVDVAGNTVMADLSTVSMALTPALQPAGAQTPAIALSTVDWDLAQQAYWVQTPAGLAVGSYGLRLTDPRGRSTIMPDAFQSLGPDVTAPSIRVEPALADDAVIGAGQVQQLYVIADDGAGAMAHIHWSTSDGNAGDCPPPPGNTPLDLQAALRRPPAAMMSCQAVLSAPLLADHAPAVTPYAFHAEATDLAGNVATLDKSLRLARLPTIASFAGDVGALVGNQALVVRGRDFLPGTQVLLDGLPLGGPVTGGEILSDESSGGPGAQIIVGLTPPRQRAGAVKVRVHSDAGYGDTDHLFTYLGPPTPRNLQPAIGSAAGGVHVTIAGNDMRSGVNLFAGASLDSRQPLYNVRYVASDKIIACMPPGAGAVSLWVEDPVTGIGLMANAFTYQDPAGGSPDPAPDCQ